MRHRSDGKGRRGVGKQPLEGLVRNYETGRGARGLGVSIEMEKWHESSLPATGLRCLRSRVQAWCCLDC
jgi:hypothetical protein